MDEGYQDVARQLAVQVSEQLPNVIYELLQTGFATDDQPLQLQCHLTAPQNNNHVPVASVDIAPDLNSLSARGTPQHGHARSPVSDRQAQSASPVRNAGTWPPREIPHSSPDVIDTRPKKRRKADSTPTNGRHKSPTGVESNDTTIARRDESRRKVQHRKRPSDNLVLQPSSLEKFVNGVWDSLYSGLRMDPTEIIEQWQAIESSGQPRLLTDSHQDVTSRREHDVFGRMNLLTRKISQTTKTCRSLEVIVQAHWVQCFDDRVADLTESLGRDKAKKRAISEACTDFSWSEKELRNKMAIWRGYHDIKNAAGWVALVFAGMGLYRFCKYRVSFTEEAFDTLKRLRHRFEVAADTLHPRWRILLGIVGGPTDRKYKGHPHDWVVNGPEHEAIPLRQTYLQWDANFSYIHLDNSRIDEEAWGDFDPRTVIPESDPAALKCQNCGEQQSNDPTQNSCSCYPNLYGSPKAGMAPVQVFRTPNGKNNGLIACCSFEKGWAVGEFVGEITTGIKGLDVMIDRTDRAGYQVWQGRAGNHTRFVNHSCTPNTHYERFVWLGKQRTVLVSDGVEAGNEITVDYGERYWLDLDKDCLCQAPNCRYRSRHVQQLIAPSNHVGEETTA